MKYLNKNNKKSFRFFKLIVILLVIAVFTSPVYNIVYGEDITSLPEDSTGGGNFLGSNPNLRIGLVFDDGMVESFQTTAQNGFVVGTVKYNAAGCFTSFFYLKNTKISVSHISNLAKNAAGRYYANNKNIVVGKYSLEFAQTFSNFTDAYSFINSSAGNFSLNVFPAYINGKITVRLGDFASTASARAYAAKVAGAGYSLNVTDDPATTAVAINPATDEILFEFQDGNNNLAIAAALPSNAGNVTYGQSITELSMNTTGLITSPANNLYSGAFIYRIHSAGVEIIGLMSLEDYVKGVVPNEISPAWSTEALKAFAIVSRTYAVHNMGKHAADGFMLCNDTHCQLYVGLKNATDATNAAVDATKGLVVTYQNKTIDAVYCSSCGGVTENHNDAWGGNLIYPYLVSVPVPFEKYADPSHANALWTKSASPSELYEYLTQLSSYASVFRKKLDSPIASIKITQRSPNSNYVKSVDITDVNGHTVNITNSDSIRIAFGRYANSANMDIYKSFKFKSNIQSASGASNQDIEAGKTYIINGNGMTKSTPGDGTLNVLSANGMSTVKAYASGSDFIFDGKGWGHGVGLSQWAMQDLALTGVGYEAIIKTFYTGVSIDNITNVKS
ncbi:MAG: SpoIID/LytB domain-containing protein [Oscillospiraceae bacterium]|nr:SpoIID/LytB domain-containing protein [Oscillospiraceae bacterium]